MPAATLSKYVTKFAPKLMPYFRKAKPIVKSIKPTVSKAVKPVKDALRPTYQKIMTGAPKAHRHAGLGRVAHTEKAFKSKGLDRFLDVVGASNKRIMRGVEDRAIKDHIFRTAKRTAKDQLKAGDIGKKTYRKAVGAAKTARSGTGGFFKRLGRDSLKDIRNPVDNIRGNIVKKFRTFDPETMKWTNKSLGGIAGGLAVDAAFTASLAAPVWKDKDTSTGKKIGKTMTYAAMPLAFNRTLPSMAAYTAADKMFSSKKKKAPQPANTYQPPMYGGYNQ